MTMTEALGALFSVILVLYGCWILGWGAFIILVGILILYKVGVLINEREKEKKGS